MTFMEIKEWLGLIRQAPEKMHSWLETTFWILVLLILVRRILEILLSQQFNALYRIVGNITKRAEGFARMIVHEAAEKLKLHESYPRLKKCCATVFMICCYAVFLIFTGLFLAFASMLMESGHLSLWKFCGGMFFSIALGYLACFFFVQAERERVGFF